MKDYYTLLAVDPGATIDDIKRAFRREIARYHPDKVHHLGREFQALAAERAAELTEAYRVLMDASLRAAYDEERGKPTGAETAWRPPAPPETPAAEPPPGAARARAEAPPEPPPREAKRPQADGGGTFVRRMAINKIRNAIERALEGVTSMPAPGFEAGYLVKGKRSLFGKAVPERVLTAYVGSVTAGAVTSLGQQALAARGAVTALTVFALGESVGPAPEISSAVTALKRRAPAGVTLSVVPLNVRDWSAMMPKDASANARSVIAQLTAKD
ncbi:MAG TPA: J domain-containing protein [Vicinamibacterales bacterium]|nr:J domain-containing protein [Vicinamibacterales bacterium]